jgi:hypothetical protein
MDLYAELYDFAASAGALEGYVYKNDRIDPAYLPKWTANLRKQYDALPEEVREAVQAMCDKTIGRAVLSLRAAIPDDHEAMGNLRSMIKGPLPESPDDFDKH